MKFHASLPRTLYNIPLVVFLVTLAGCESAPRVAPVSDPFAVTTHPRWSVGDTYVYRYLDGYRNNPPGQVSFEISSIENNHVVLNVTPTVAREGVVRTELHTRDGGRLRIPIDSHAQPVEYVFAQPYPAYLFPLAPGKSWSVRVKASDESKRERNVLVQGKVMGAERIKVPAGEFDVIKVRRYTYPADADHRPATRIQEIEWYAPSLGRAVRMERQGEWIEPASACSDPIACDGTRHGEWHVYELESIRTSAP